MNTCFVCNGKMHDYFVKHENYAVIGKNIDRKFIKCERCGLVIDQTSYDMSPEERTEINNTVLCGYQHAQQTEAFLRRDNRIKQQALFVYQVLRTGIFRTDSRIVDYGCATGELVKYVEQLRAESHEILPSVRPYDKYYRVEGGGLSL